MLILLTQGTLESHTFVWKWKFHLLLRNMIQSIIFLFWNYMILQIKATTLVIGYLHFTNEANAFALGHLGI